MTAFLSPMRKTNTDLKGKTDHNISFLRGFSVCILPTQVLNGRELNWRGFQRTMEVSVVVAKQHGKRQASSHT